MPPRPPRRFLDRLGGRPATGGRTRHQDPRTRGGNRRHAPAACQEALTRQAHLKTDHARPKDTEHHSEAIETLKSDLDRALRAADPRSSADHPRHCPPGALSLSWCGD